MLFFLSFGNAFSSMVLSLDALFNGCRVGGNTRRCWTGSIARELDPLRRAIKVLLVLNEQLMGKSSVNWSVLLIYCHSVLSKWIISGILEPDC